MSTRIEVCHDCKYETTKPTVYVMGAIRCPMCTNIFDLKRSLEAAIQNRSEWIALQEHIKAGHPDDGVTCEDCCEHGEYDHGICYDCGKDCMDDLVGAAEYAYEGDR